MPTLLDRTQITHTPPIQHALGVAAKYWPEDSARPSALLARLATKGAQELEQEDAGQQADILAKRASAAGCFPGMFSESYLAELREGWPE